MIKIACSLVIAAALVSACSFAARAQSSGCFDDICPPQPPNSKTQTGQTTGETQIPPSPPATPPTGNSSGGSTGSGSAGTTGSGSTGATGGGNNCGPDEGACPTTTPTTPTT